MELDIPEIIRVTDNHLVTLKNLKIQAERSGDLAAVYRLAQAIVTTELVLEELRQKPSVQSG
jgi:hypothetical protein